MYVKTHLLSPDVRRRVRLVAVVASLGERCVGSTTSQVSDLISVRSETLTELTVTDFLQWGVKRRGTMPVSLQSRL